LQILAIPPTILWLDEGRRMIQLDQNVVNGVTVLHFQGSLTQEEVASIEPQFLAALAAKPPRVVIDLADVDAVTTPAISMFLASSRSAEKAGGKVIFTGVRGLIADILHRCRLDAILTIATSMDAAMARARQ
jgi:anti-anti-sigma factor